MNNSTPQQHQQHATKHTKSNKNKNKADIRDAFHRINGIVMANMKKEAEKHKEMSVEKDVKMFGQKAIGAVSKKIVQFNDLKTFILNFARELTMKAKRTPLNLITKIKQKCRGRIKAAGCVLMVESKDCT